MDLVWSIFMWKCKWCNNDFEFETVSQKANHSR